MKQSETSACFRVIRTLNIVTSCVIFGLGLFGFIFMALKSLLNGKIFLIFSPIFMMVFGVLLFAAECKLAFIVNKCGFLKTMLGRGIFNIYLASEVFFYFSCESGDDVLAYAMGLILFGIGFIYIGLNFCGGKEYNERMKQ